MNVLERIRSKFWSYRLLVKCRRNKLYWKMERERDTGENEKERKREREKEREIRESDIYRERVKGIGIESERVKGKNLA